MEAVVCEDVGREGEAGGGLGVGEVLEEPDLFYGELNLLGEVAVEVHCAIFLECEEGENGSHQFNISRVEFK